MTTPLTPSPQSDTPMEVAVAPAPIQSPPPSSVEGLSASPGSTIKGKMKFKSQSLNSLFRQQITNQTSTLTNSTNKGIMTKLLLILESLV